jgi:hypothetical protein
MCKINHSDPDSIPAFLCLACNPREPDRKFIAEATERVESDARLQLDTARRRVHKLRSQVGSLERHIKGASDPKSRAISDNAIDGKRKRLAEAEAALAELEAT